MQNHMTIWERKAGFEKFSKEAMRSEYLQKLSRNNRSHRHLVRFIMHVLLFTLFLVLAASAFHKSLWLGLAIYPFYLFFLGLVIAGFMIHSHELSHNHIKSKNLNDLVGVLSGLVSFINFYSFQRAHRLHHRNIGNLDAPEAGAPVSPKGQRKILHDDFSRDFTARIFGYSYALGFLASWPIFIYYGDYNSWLLPFRDKGQVNRASVWCFALLAIINLSLLILFPTSYLFLYFVPMLFGGQRILAVTYMHHAHEDSVFFSEEHHNIHNVIMSTTDRDFGPLVNFFMLNNGYHIPHHLNPHIAYYDLKKANRHLRDTLPEELNYNFYPKSRFYRDFAYGLYEQRLQNDQDYYQLRFLTPDVPGAKTLMRLMK